MENWNTVNTTTGMKCPGEAIWTAAQAVIDDAARAGKLPDDATYQFGYNFWGAAINPVSRRGQHQVAAR